MERAGGIEPPSLAWKAAKRRVFLPVTVCAQHFTFLGLGLEELQALGGVGGQGEILAGGV